MGEEGSVMARSILFAALVLVGCTDEAGARRVLEAQGMTKVELTGYAVFACGRDDTSQTGFRAISPAGVPVSGSVCCGLVFKNCTIRFE